MSPGSVLILTSNWLLNKLSPFWRHVEQLPRPLQWPFEGDPAKALFGVSGFGGGCLPQVPHPGVYSSFPGPDWIPVQPSTDLGSLVGILG